MEFVSAVFALRASEPALRRGSWRIAGAGGDAAAYERRLDGTRLVIALNAGTSDARLGIEVPDAVDGHRLVPIGLPGWPGQTTEIGRHGRTELALAARSGGVWRLA
jgi:hypothetical protein